MNQVFTLDFESKPLYTDADYSLSLNVQPVEIVYDEVSKGQLKSSYLISYKEKGYINFWYNSDLASDVQEEAIVVLIFIFQ